MDQHLNIYAHDVTGQRSTNFTVPVNTLWGVVTLQAVERLHLPDTDQITQTPIVYHCFEGSVGDLLQADMRVSDVIEHYQADLEFRVRIVPELEAAGRSR
jgi:hypothetical protein